MPFPLPYTPSTFFKQLPPPPAASPCAGVAEVAEKGAERFLPTGVVLSQGPPSSPPGPAAAETRRSSSQRVLPLACASAHFISSSACAFRHRPRPSAQPLEHSWRASPAPGISTSALAHERRPQRRPRPCSSGPLNRTRRHSNTLTLTPQLHLVMPALPARLPASTQRPRRRRRCDRLRLPPRQRR